jgi:hypothetical protein
LLALSSSASAREGFGLSPYVGAAFRTDGGEDDVHFVAGANLTYGFTDWFGIGVGYSRIFTPSDEDVPDTNLVGSRAILSAPLAIVEPYVAAGPGYYWEVAGPDDESGLFFDAAAGVGVDLVVLRVSGEVSFRALDDGQSYLQPAVWLNIGF